MVDVVIVGGGPSGLAAAVEALAHGARAVVVERLDRVGGLARTLTFGDHRFDIGPHRFFTTNAEVQALFTRFVGDDLLHVERRTRIVHAGRYFDYPLTPLNAVRGMGVGESLATLSSYARARARHHLVRPQIDSFEDWIVDRFGRRLHETFFAAYTEKVWGVPCTQIGAEWAAQRIKGLTLGGAIREALAGRRKNGPRTLVQQFLYPRGGAGQPYERMAAAVEQAGSRIMTGATMCGLRRDGMRVRAVVVVDGRGHRHEIDGRHHLVSAPLTELVALMAPEAPAAVVQAARALRYRHHIGVHLVVDGCPFPDNWLYVHSRDLATARITNHRNFSAAMAGRPDTSPLTVEFFASAGDGIWEASDAALVDRAVRELGEIGLVRSEQVQAGFVVRSANAYPLMEIGAERHVRTIRAWLAGFENLLPIGRSGMFKYNNQDHAMATGLIAARTVLGIERLDPWLVNVDAEYHEGAPAAALRSWRAR